MQGGAWVAVVEEGRVEADQGPFPRGGRAGDGLGRRLVGRFGGVVVASGTVLVENVLTLDLDVVDLGLENLLPADAILLVIRQSSIFLRLLLDLDLTLLLLAENRVVLLIRVERRVALQQACFWLAKC